MSLTRYDRHSGTRARYRAVSVINSTDELDIFGMISSGERLTRETVISLLTGRISVQDIEVEFSNKIPFIRPSHTEPATH